MENVYRPGEDSYLLARHVRRLVHGEVLDMGTGSGIQAVEAAVKPEVSRVVAVDVSPAALEEAKRRAESGGVLGKIEKLDELSLFFETLFCVALTPS
jgi:release factor glutamine methyltransferase